MKKVLIVSGHPDLAHSIANKAALEHYAQKLPQAEFVYLDQLYPDFQIDVAAEHEKLREADIIVLQYPLFWYNVPALMQKWFEEILLPGFAYGEQGDALKGKKVISAITIGAPESCYGNDVPILPDQLSLPIQSTAAYTGMDYLGGEYICNAENDPLLSDEAKEKIAHEAEKMAERVIERIEKA